MEVFFVVEKMINLNMKSKKFVIFAAIVFVAVLGFVIFGKGGEEGEAKTPTQSASVLGALEKDFDFGTIAMKNGDVSKVFELENEGTESILISKVYTSCMCTVAKIITAKGDTSGPYGMPGHGGGVSKANIKVRQPLRAVHLGLSNEFPGDLEVLVKGELNVKEIVYDKSQKDLVFLNTELDEALIYEGYARELMRQIQDMRKEAGYKIDDEIFGQWHSDNLDLSTAITKWSDETKKDVLLNNFENSQKSDKVFDIEKEFELVAGKKIWVGVKK